MNDNRQNGNPTGENVCIEDNRYILGLTGNISTGKSVVRKMLEHLGALGIDADALSHRAISKDTAGYRQVVKKFGRQILDDREYIDRRKLGSIVFSDPARLSYLEGIIHPAVDRYVHRIIDNAQQNVIVIEAIKVLESNLSQLCDQIWVTTTNQDVQLTRMVENRHMDENEALIRIRAQSPQENKISRADVVIDNQATFAQTWQQVLNGWVSLFPLEDFSSFHHDTGIFQTGNDFVSLHSSPFDAEIMARFLTKSTGIQTNREDIISAFSRHHFSLLFCHSELSGIMKWQTDNFVSIVQETIIDPALNFKDAYTSLEEAVTTKSKRLLCEAMLSSIPDDHPATLETHIKAGYNKVKLDAMKNQVCWEAAKKYSPHRSNLMVKYLTDAENIFAI